MNIKVPFKKNIKFSTPIAEITSISLEHEITVNEDSLLGDFIVMGEYKEHPVSVNTLDFSYNVPFDVALPDHLKKETITFEVNDFTYQIANNDSLDLNIEFTINGEEAEIQSELKEETENINPVELEELIDENQEERKDSKKTVMDIATTSEETFITYRIHIIKANDTKELIANKYNISDTLLDEYNDMSNLKPGNKLIIPIDE